MQKTCVKCGKRKLYEQKIVREYIPGYDPNNQTKNEVIKMLNEKQDKNKSTDSNTTTLLENCDLVEAPPEEIQDAGDF